jgi:prepilin-type N-terminal cleavage/methylation domain-containing protein/prepilin-type processing-associated H-X9-DG protein
MERRQRGLTLTELLVVMGLIAVLISLLIPVVSKARAAARATTCLSNLRQMGTAWTMYTAEYRGCLLPYVWNTPTTPDVAWSGYWPGALDAFNVRGESLLCPSANEPIDVAPRRGYGNAIRAWTGKYSSNGTAIKLNAETYRNGSYGYNRYMTAGGGQGVDGNAVRLTAVQNISDTPLFMDCAYADVEPDNGEEAAPVEPPPDLQGGSVTPGTPEHWKITIARHGVAINVCMADGSVRRTPLAELYMMTWKSSWQKYLLPLPSH